MDIELYYTDSPNIALSKNLVSNKLVTGTLRSEVDTLSPTLLLEADKNLLLEYNYCHIPATGKFYFLKTSKIIRTGLLQIDLHEDVLQTFSTDIKKLGIIASRSETLTSLYNPDERFKLSQKTETITKVFPSGKDKFKLTEKPFILTVAGGGGA